MGDGGAMFLGFLMATLGLKIRPDNITVSAYLAGAGAHSGRPHFRYDARFHLALPAAACCPLPRRARITAPIASPTPVWASAAPCYALSTRRRLRQPRAADWPSALRPWPTLLAAALLVLAAHRCLRSRTPPLRTPSEREKSAARRVKARRTRPRWRPFGLWDILLLDFEVGLEGFLRLMRVAKSISGSDRRACRCG